MLHNLSWDEELILSKWEPPIELSEDVLVMMLRKNPLLQELIEHFELEMEF